MIRQQYQRSLGVDEIVAPIGINEFPCQDLCNINRLWTKYSRGKFGFSVQNKIWRLYSENWESFIDNVGWIITDANEDYDTIPYSELTFDISAPLGHLPGFLLYHITDFEYLNTDDYQWYGGSGCIGDTPLLMRLFFSRLRSCKVSHAMDEGIS